MKTATIQFRAKVQTLENVDGTTACQYVVVPILTRSHCDMSAFRQHPRYGGYANSQLFPGMLARIRDDLQRGRIGLPLDALPDNVTVDTSGFLALVTITV